VGKITITHAHALMSRMHAREDRLKRGTNKVTQRAIGNGSPEMVRALRAGIIASRARQVWMRFSFWNWPPT
jgi:hypothetical protein